jgi:hypothetical protein
MATTSAPKTLTNRFLVVFGSKKRVLFASRNSMPAPLQLFVFWVPKHCGAMIRWKIPKKGPKPRKKSKTLSPNWNSSPYPLPIIFLLVVDDFGVKYTKKADAEHLMSCPLKEYYKVTEDWEGERYCGLTIKWDYENHTCDI